MNEEIQINVRKLRPFTRFIYTIGELPTSYLMSMTYEEQLIWFCNYLEKTVIPAINNNGQAVEELQAKYIELKSYVDNYFDNLDVQEEINNKLDDMAESGVLAEIIAQYIQLTVSYTFNTVSDLSGAENLVSGSYAETLGFNAIGDGGASKYYIRTVTNSDVVDGYTKIALTNTDDLIAVLVIPNILNVHQFGIFGDGETDVTAKLNKAFNYNCYLPAGTYLISDTVELNNHLIYGDGIDITVIKLDDNSTVTNYSPIIAHEIDTINIKNITFDGNEENQTNPYPLVSLFTCTNLCLENCKLTNNFGSMLKLNDSVGVRVINCVFKNSRGVSGSTGPGIMGNPVNDLIIEGCKADNIADHFLYLTSDDEDKYSKNIIVKNCVLNSCGEAGLTAGSALCIYANSQDIIIDNCIIKNSRSAIFVGQHGEYTFTPKNVMISNCMIDTITLSAFSIKGSSVDDVENVKINNCVLKNVTQMAIVTDYVKNMSISNCDIFDNWYGIGNGNTDYLTIDNCTVHDNTGGGILIGESGHSCEYVNLNNNVVYNNEIGLYMNIGDKIKLFNCDVFGNTTDISENVVTNTSYVNMVDKKSTNRVIPSLTFSNAIPSSGTYKTGDIILFNTGSPDYAGAICTAGGTPGTWRTFN